MGRRKQSTGRGRRGTGKKYIKRSAAKRNTGRGDTGAAGESTGGESGASTENTGAEVVGILAADNSIIVERAPMELLEQSPAAPEPIPEILAAEAAAALSEAPADTGAAPSGAPAQAPYDPDMATEWDMYMAMAVNLIAKVVLPQWNLTDEEKHELTKSTAHILQDLFPGGLSGRYAPYLRLIVVSGAIVITRHKEHGGKLPGLGPKRDKEEVIASQ
jgi:hypothetical protein